MEMAINVYVYCLHLCFVFYVGFDLKIQKTKIHLV